MADSKHGFVSTVVRAFRAAEQEFSLHGGIFGAVKAFCKVVGEHPALASMGLEVEKLVASMRPQRVAAGPTRGGSRNMAAALRL